MNMCPHPRTLILLELFYFAAARFIGVSQINNKKLQPAIWLSIFPNNILGGEQFISVKLEEKLLVGAIFYLSFLFFFNNREMSIGSIAGITHSHRNTEPQ